MLRQGSGQVLSVQRFAMVKVRVISQYTCEDGRIKTTEEQGDLFCNSVPLLSLLLCRGRWFDWALL